MDRPTAGPMTHDIRLRNVTAADLPIFFEQQLDPESNRMAAFTAENPADRAAFMTHWTKILGDETIVTRTILVDGQIAGHISVFEQFGKPSVSYRIARRFWGQGVATAALTALLGQVTLRPLYGRAAKDNLGSLRVMQKCGFTICGEDVGFANARGADVEEYILRLDASADDAA